MLATYVVNTFDDLPPSIGDNSVISLREAVILANQNPGPDRIELEPGTYNLSIAGMDEENSFTGDLDVSDDIEIAGLGSNPDEVVIDANLIDRIFDFHRSNGPPITWTLDNLTLRRGSTPVDIEVAPGGGSDIDDAATIEVAGFTIELHKDGRASSNSNIRVPFNSNDTNEEVADAIVASVADILPDAVRVAGTGKVTLGNDSTATFSVSGKGLSVPSRDDRPGGAIRSRDANGRMLRLVVSRNISSIFGGGGGAIQAKNGSLLVRSSQLTGNRTLNSNGGGAIVGIELDDFTLEGSTIDNNSSPSGGVIVIEANQVNISNTTITDNVTLPFRPELQTQAEYIRISSPEANVIHSTIVSPNSSNIQTPPFPISPNVSSTVVTIANSLVDLSGDSVQPESCIFVQQDGVGGGAGFSFTDENGETVTSSSFQATRFESSVVCGTLATNLMADTNTGLATPLMLGPLRSVEGGVPVRMPSATGPLIDLGGSNTLAVDARGLPRPVAKLFGGNAVSDIGAVELQRDEINLPPVANLDFASFTIEGANPTSPLTISEDALIRHLLLNDSAGDDAFGSTFTLPEFVSISSVGSLGGAMQFDGGRATYTPTGAEGDDDFTYQITDGEFTSEGIFRIRRVASSAVDNDSKIDFGRSLQSIAVSPNTGRTDTFQFAVVSEFDNKLSIVDAELTIGNSIRVSPEDVKEVVLSGRPRKVTYSEDGRTIAVAAIGAGRERGSVFVIRDGILEDKWTADYGPVDVAIGDFDLDGTEDFATANFRTGVIGFNRGSDGTFIKVGGGSNAQHIETVDMNGDGLKDLAVYFLGYPAGPAGPAATIALYLKTPTGFREPIIVDADQRVVDLDIRIEDASSGAVLGPPSTSVVTTAENGTVRSYSLVAQQLVASTLIRSNGQLRGAAMGADSLAIINATDQTLEIYGQDESGDLMLLARKPIASPLAIAHIPNSEGPDRLPGTADDVVEPLFAVTSLYDAPTSLSFSYPGAVQITGLTERIEPSGANNLILFSEPTSEAPVGLAPATASAEIVIEEASGELPTESMGSVVALAEPETVEAEDEAVGTSNIVTPAVVSELALASNETVISSPVVTSLAEGELPYDVNRDDRVSPLDALAVINRLTSIRDPLADAEQIDQVAADDRADVNQDGRVSPLDALMIINHISRKLGSQPATQEPHVVSFSVQELKRRDEIFADSGLLF